MLINKIDCIRLTLFSTVFLFSFYFNIPNIKTNTISCCTSSITRRERVNIKTNVTEHFLSRSFPGQSNFMKCQWMTNSFSFFLTQHSYYNFIFFAFKTFGINNFYKWIISLNYISVSCITVYPSILHSLSLSPSLFTFISNFFFFRFIIFKKIKRSKIKEKKKLCCLCEKWKKNIRQFNLGHFGNLEKFNFENLTSEI